jgi:hypothetical protein
VLADIDRYYSDRSEDDESVVTALTLRLASPSPRDQQTLSELPRYKKLAPRWQSWAEVAGVCADLAQRLAEPGGVDV